MRRSSLVARRSRASRSTNDERRTTVLQGFTLVEVALTTSLFAFLLAALGGLLTSSGRVQTGWQQRVQPALQCERALARWAQDVQSAQPFFGLPFTVEGAAMEFAAVGLAATGEGGAAQAEWLRIRYAVEDEQMVRETYLWREGATTALTREVLAPLASGQFAMAKRDPQTSLLEWSTAWNGTLDDGPHVARLVRFEGTLPAVGGHSVAVSHVVRHPAGVLPDTGTP